MYQVYNGQTCLGQFDAKCHRVLGGLLMLYASESAYNANIPKAVFKEWSHFVGR
jgi:hypothetical protein